MRISEIIKKFGLKKKLPEVAEPFPDVIGYSGENRETTSEKTDSVFSLPEESSLKGERKLEFINQYGSLPAEQIYGEAINSIKGVFTSFLESNKLIFDFKLIKETVKKIVAKILSTDNQITALVNKSTPDNYLYAHSVNVCILSIKLASRLGWSEDKLTLLGISALFHDIGMVFVFSLVTKPGRLTLQEYEQIKKHPLYGKKILEKLNNEIEENVKELLILIAYQQHERIDGQGYPQGLRGKDLHEFVKIIGLVDVYESLTHPRPHRESMLPREALCYLIATSEGKFDPTLLRIFVEELSLYPLGSFVKLNTEEIGEVVKINHRFLNRPVLKVILGTNGEKLEPERYVDLTEILTLHIWGPVDETKLKINDKKLMLKLKLRRWWMS